MGNLIENLHADSTTSNQSAFQLFTGNSSTLLVHKSLLSQFLILISVLYNNFVKNEGSASIFTHCIFHLTVVFMASQKK